MIADKILYFFSGVENTQQFNPEIETIKDFNQQIDTTKDINRKKTAQLGKIMVNSFNKDEEFFGKILCIYSQNRYKGYMKNALQNIKDIKNTLQEILGSDIGNKILEENKDQIPLKQDYNTQKTIIISDFFWPKKDLDVCIQSCKENKIRCIVIPLLTNVGFTKHPLSIRYPQYFWSIDI